MYSGSFIRTEQEFLLRRITLINIRTSRFIEFIYFVHITLHVRSNKLNNINQIYIFINMNVLTYSKRTKIVYSNINSIELL